MRQDNSKTRIKHPNTHQIAIKQPIIEILKVGTLPAMYKSTLLKPRVT
ncbi:conserved hypothetical protein [Vibrio crassostreae]|nr:conserved hypothetical protein [Vibrio crassostreae]CAK3649481.1 conserved hypothetical protein [Vibrio crassostreae]